MLCMNEAMMLQAKNAKTCWPVGRAKSNPKVECSRKEGEHYWNIKELGNTHSHQPRKQLKQSPEDSRNAVAESVCGYLRLLEDQSPDLDVSKFSAGYGTNRSRFRRRREVVEY